MILSITDFVSDYCIASDDYTGAELEVFIEDKEKEILSEILGANLYMLFKMEVELNNGVPTSTRFLSIYNESVFELGCSIEYLYCGMKKMLSKAIFFKYAIHQRNNNTISGNMQHKHQVSKSSDYSRTELTRIWNDFVKDAKMLQSYMMDNQDDSEEINFIEYKGSKIHGASII